MKDWISSSAEALADGRLLDGRGGTDRELFLALDCAYADRWDYAADFLKRCLRACDWAESSGALTSTRCVSMFPLSLGEVQTYRAYALWLQGAPLDRGAVKEASALCLRWLDESGEVQRGKPQDLPIFHEFCMTALRSALICGDVSFARAHLRRLRLKWYMEDQRVLFLRLLDEYPKPNQQLRDDFERWFNLCRDPDAKEWHKDLGQVFRVDMTRFEVGIIRQMYLVNARLDDRVDARAVIEAIRA